MSKLERERLAWCSTLYDILDGYAEQNQLGELYTLTKDDRMNFLLDASYEVVVALELERVEGVNVPQQWVKLWKRTAQSAARLVEDAIISLISM